MFMIRMPSRANPAQQIQRADPFSQRSRPQGLVAPGDHHDPRQAARIVLQSSVAYPHPDPLPDSGGCMRLLLLGQGWRDQSDADRLRHDPSLRVASQRTRRGTIGLAAEGHGLASQPTLSRLLDEQLSLGENLPVSCDKAVTSWRCRRRIPVLIEGVAIGVTTRGLDPTLTRHLQSEYRRCTWIASLTISRTLELHGLLPGSASQFRHGSVCHRDSAKGVWGVCTRLTSEAFNTLVPYRTDLSVH